MALLTFANLRTDVLRRAGQAIDTTSDVYTLTEEQLVRAAHEIENEHPYLFLRVDPPYAFNTVAPITTGTVNVANGSVNITFSSAPTPSVAGREILITGWQEAYRIATHTAGATAATLDVAYNGTANTVAEYTVFKREYDLSPDPPLRHIVEMVVAGEGWLIDQKDEGWLRKEYKDPPHAVWPPSYFARIGETRIRFEGYPDRARRIEVAYTQIPDDIDTGTILIPSNWRYVIADGALAWVWSRLNDDRAALAAPVFGAGKEKMITDDLRKRAVVSMAGRNSSGPYR